MNQRGQASQKLNLPQKLSEWEGEAFIGTARNLAKGLPSGLDTQLRRIFDSIRKVELDFKREGKFSPDSVLLLKPRLAYVVARHEKLSSVFHWLNEAIDRVKDEGDFKRLVQFMEAILAYYKYETKTKKS